MLGLSQRRLEAALALLGYSVDHDYQLAGLAAVGSGGALLDCVAGKGTGTRIIGESPGRE